LAGILPTIDDEYLIACSYLDSDIHPAGNEKKQDFCEKQKTRQPHFQYFINL
jgi:hypothetical protein